MKKILAVLAITMAGFFMSCSVSEQPLTQNGISVSESDAGWSGPGNIVQDLNVVLGAHQFNPAITKDTSGNYIVVWVDTRNGVRDVYAHKLQPSGYTVWDDKKVNGTALTSNTTYIQKPKVACDASGNIYVLYAQSSGNLRLRKLNSSGTAIWEVRADTATYPVEWVNYDLAVDSSANVYVVYQRLASYGAGSFVSKFNTSGTLLWNNKNAGGIGNDPCIVVTGSYINIGSSGRILRIDANGNYYWNLAVTAGKNRIANDASGNVYSALNYSYSIYYTKYNLNGTKTYGSVAIASGTSTYPKDSPEITINSSGDKFIVFRDTFVRVGQNDTTIRGQKINSANTVLWTAGGVEVCRGDFVPEYGPDVAADPSGGLFNVYYANYYYNTWFVWGNGINSSGVKYWTGDLLISQPAWPPASSSSVSSSSVSSISSSSVSSSSKPSSSSSSVVSSSSSSISSSSSSVNNNPKLVLYSETYPQSITWWQDITTNESPSDPNVLSFVTGGAGEGNQCFKIHVNSNMFNVNWLRLPIVTYLDLTAYKNGTLHLMIKATKGISVSIHIAENYDIMVHLTNNGMYGFYMDNQWHSVTIPMTEYSVVRAMDMTRLYGYLKFYGGYYEGVAGGEDYYIDNVYFQQ